MNHNRFSNWPVFAEDEIQAVVEVLRSGKVNYWTGDECKAFEREFSAFCGTKHAIALANGTVALELALRVLGIGSGDEVVVTPRSFIASASCVVQAGAKAVFADVDPNSQNMTSETIRKVLSPKTKAIIAVHLAGWPCDMAPILALADEYNLKVIEDCAQAHGAQYDRRRVGSFGDIGVFSFCQDKIMTTGGEGGMLVTDDADIWSEAWSFKEHGKSYEAVYGREHPVGFRWLHESIGSNLRMTEMQAAIGRRQLSKLPEWSRARGRNADRLTRCFREIPALRVTEPGRGLVHAYYKYYAFVQPDRLKPGWSRDRIIDAINAEGVPCFSGSCAEIYLEKAFEGLEPAERLPVARELGETSLMFLLQPTLGGAEMDEVCSTVAKIFRQAGMA